MKSWLRGFGRLLAAALALCVSALAQGRVSQFLGVPSWHGALSITGSGSGSTSGGIYSDVWQYSITSNATVLLDTYNSNIEGWTGTFTGTSAINASDVASFGGCNETQTQAFQGALDLGKTFTMHLQGTNQYVFYPSDYLAQGGTNTVSIDCAPGTQGGATPVNWAPVLSVLVQNLPATGFSLTGSATTTMNSPMQPISAAFGGTPAVINVTVTWDFEPSCTPVLGSTSGTSAASGGAGSLSVTAPAQCSWTATSNSSFIAITSGASGTGNGTVNYSVAANTSSAARTGSMTIAPAGATGNAGSATFTITQSAGGPTGSGMGFYPVTPCRVVDTRNGQGAGGFFGPPRMAQGETRSIPIPLGACNIPATAQAYALNVTVVPPAPLTYLSIWPTGQAQPLVSTLNAFDGAVVANAAIVPAGQNGAVSLFVSDATDVIVDINGYFAPPAQNALAFYAATPCRVMDTRTGQGTSGAFGPPRMSAGETRSIPIAASSCNIPSTARAYALNVTVAPPAALTYLSIWPAGQAQPVVSTLNSFDGRVVANAAIVPAGTGPGGPIYVFVSDASDVIVDINGYFAPYGASGALQFYSATPCRISDTRTGQGFTGAFGPPSLGVASTRTFPIPSSSCGLPAAAQAYSLNMTAVPPGPLIYLTTWPAGAAQPLVSTLNSFQGKVVANAAIVPAGTSGAIDVFVSNLTDLIIDGNGYFAQ